MRTIKFRGKEIQNGIWVEGYYRQHKTSIGTFSHIVTEDGVDYIVEPETVGQLVKSYGKDYYEGDVAKTKDEANLTVILTWINEHAMYSWITVDEYRYLQATGSLDMDKVMFFTYAFENMYCDDLNVIGNIHDNPDLLK